MKESNNISYSIAKDGNVFLLTYKLNNSTEVKSLYIDTLKICHEEITTFNVSRIGEESISKTIWLELQYNTVKTTAANHYAKLCSICINPVNGAYHVFKENWDD